MTIIRQLIWCKLQSMLAEYGAIIKTLFLLAEIYDEIKC